MKVLLVLISTFYSATSISTISKDILSHPNWKLLDREDDCGISNTDRIIGGYEARLGQFPWMARLLYEVNLENDEYGYLYECGGTIINERYILTAAHCSSEALGIDMVEVRLGEHDVNTETDCRNGECADPVQDIKVEEEKCHKGYTQETFHHDICLVRLAKPIKFNDYVYPICLPAFEDLHKKDFEGSIMETAGWGVTDIDTEETGDVLMALKVPIVNKKICELAYSGLAEITSKQLCAGGVIGKDSCSGDSGGPLMKPFAINGPPRFFIIGIVSFGPKKCADSETPGVYTIVSEYWKWILDNIRE